MAGDLSNHNSLTLFLLLIWNKQHIQLSSKPTAGYCLSQMDVTLSSRPSQTPRGHNKQICITGMKSGGTVFSSQLCHDSLCDPRQVLDFSGSLFLQV